MVEKTPRKTVPVPVISTSSSIQQLFDDRQESDATEGLKQGGQIPPTVLMTQTFKRC